MVKTPEELGLLRTSGKLLASVFDMLDQTNLAGLSTMQINDLVDRFITNDLRARPASKGQYDYEYVLNCSVNDVVCHGVPSDKVVLRSGDIVNLDITLEKNGFVTDSSKTYVIGEVPARTNRLVRAAEGAMWSGIKQVRPGATLGDVGYAINRFARKQGYAAVREYCGHGIGREMHEEPQVLNYGKRGQGLTLREGMVFTIEPMVNEGSRKTKTLDDGWTVVTEDGKLSAQFEHTIAVTRTGFEVLTLRKHEELLPSA
ncbi:MAG: type I methionyl aminopeptidase [Pseudomonadota bacterium]